MITVSGNRLICVDVDDSLVFLEAPGPKLKSIVIPFQGEFIRVWPNHKLIKQLWKYQQRQFVLWVWSQQGAEWVDAVIDTLELRPLFHMASVKPEFCIDDLPVNDWLPRKKP